MDLGCYAIHQVRAAVGEEPAVEYATSALNPLGADLNTYAELSFPSGITASVSSSMVEGNPYLSSLSIFGTDGTARVGNLVFPSRGHSVTVSRGADTRQFTVAGRETYDHQLEAVVHGIASGRQLPTEGTDPVANMATIDAIYTAAGIDR